MIHSSFFDSVNLDIGGVLSRFEFQSCDLIKLYLEREFLPFMKTESKNSENLLIRIFSGKDQKYLYDKHTADWSKNGAAISVTQQIRARFRFSMYNFKFDEDKRIIVDLYIPYKIKNSMMEKVLSPSYLERWNRCLIDFIHGPFLIFLQYQLLDRKKTLIHAGAIIRNGSVSVISGDAQVGKSTLIDGLLDDDSISVLSEDYVIIGDNIATAYPKQTRTYYDSWIKKRLRNDTFEEKCNIATFFLFSKLRFMGVEAKRVVDYDELYGKERLSKNGKYGLVYFLKRDGEDVSIKEICDYEAARVSTENLKNEFGNIDGFYTIITSLCQSQDLNVFFDKVYKVFLSNYHNKKLLDISIPFYNDKKSFVFQFERIISKHVEFEQY